MDETLREVTAHDLFLHVDARGWLMPMVYDDLGYIKYVYATTCYPGVVKAWHRHAEHTDRLWCVSGMARIVVATLRGGEHAEPGTLATMYYETHEFVIGPLAPKVVVIPPGWWHGFTPVGPEPCVIINAPDRAYDPEDEERKPIEAIPFPWREVDG